jgi:hypothetical protein
MSFEREVPPRPRLRPIKFPTALRLIFNPFSQIRDAVELIQHMPLNDKILAVEFWNEISEKLQDVVNSAVELLEDNSAKKSPDLSNAEAQNKEFEDSLKVRTEDLPFYRKPILATMMSEYKFGRFWIFCT